jgi:hypothetical protein
MSPICAICSGLLLTVTSYSVLPMRIVPAGVMMFCDSTASTTACGDSPRAATASGSMSIMTWRCLPP